MYNSIEITDSDDDLLESTMDVAKPLHSNETDEEPLEKQHKSSADLKNLPKVSADCVASTSANANLSKPQVRHRPRKTQHTVRNAAETEIQFESIPLDDDNEDEPDVGGLPAPEQQISANKKLMTSMLSKPEVQEIVDRIANERVRCNFLLATFHLPDIDFKLNTPLEVLKYQFYERVKNLDANK